MSTRPRPTGKRHRARIIGAGNTQPLTRTAALDPAALEADLREALKGEVRFSDGDRALYAVDGSNYRQVPIGVVIPAHVDDVLTTLAIARAHGAPVLARGGGTSLAGQCCNVAVVMDLSKYFNRILAVDAERQLARVEPGCVLDELRAATKRFGLTFGPDPSTHNHNTLGGMIGNDSCGVHSVQSEFYGPGARTAEQIEDMEIVTADGLRMRVGPTPPDELERIIAEGGRRGEIYRGMRDLRDRYAGLIRTKYPNIVRRVSGYNLPYLLPENDFNVARALVGSEGTLATVLEATVRLIPDPPKRALLVLGYPTVYDAGNHVPQLREFKPLALEGMDELIPEFMRRKKLLVEDLTELPPGKGWIFAEFGGDTQEEANDLARQALAAIERAGNPPTMRLYCDPKSQDKLWTIRRSGLESRVHVLGWRSRRGVAGLYQIADCFVLPSLVEGWSLGGIASARTGFPLSLSAPATVVPPPIAASTVTTSACAVGPLCPGFHVRFRDGRHRRTRGCGRRVAAPVRHRTHRSGSRLRLDRARRGH